MCGNIGKPARTQYVVCMLCENTIIDGGSTALYTAYTVDTVDTDYTIHGVGDHCALSTIFDFILSHVVSHSIASFCMVLLGCIASYCIVLLFCISYITLFCILVS